MDPETFPALRLGVVHLIEMLDKVLRAHSKVVDEDATMRRFHASVAKSLREVAELPKVRPLLGRVREASPEEIMAAAIQLNQIAQQQRGRDIVASLSKAAADAGKVDVADVLNMRAQEMEHRRN